MTEGIHDMLHIVDSHRAIDRAIRATERPLPAEYAAYPPVGTPRALVPAADIEPRIVDITISGWTPTEIPGQMVRCSYVPDELIPPDHRAFVRYHVDRVSDWLGLGHVTVKWFGPTPRGAEPDFLAPSPEANRVPAGMVSPTEPMTVVMNASARGDGLIVVIAHEVRHVQQHLLLAKIRTPELREADADEFAAFYMAHEPR